MKDLFDYPHEIPNKVNEVLAKYDQDEANLSYEKCAQLVKDLNSIGYSCDYGLDGIPFDLRKIKEYNLDILTEQGPKTVFFYRFTTNRGNRKSNSIEIRHIHNFKMYPIIKRTYNVTFV